MISIFYTVQFSDLFLFEEIDWLIVFIPLHYPELIIFHKEESQK